jgi:predicted amidohydrolase
MSLRVSAIQLDVGVDESLEERRDRVAAAVRAEAAAGANAVMLPEMWPIGWLAFDRYDEVAEPADGPTAAFLSDLARETGTTLVGGTFVERHGDHLHNSAPVHGPDGARLALYRKIHLFSEPDGDAAEAERMAAGEEVTVFPLAGTTVGLSICYDLRFPELYRRQVDAGAEILFVVAAWPQVRVDAWRTLIRARAIENQAAIVGCDAAGEQAGQPYAGASLAFDARGAPLGELGSEPGALRALLDRADIRAARDEFPALRDRRLV